MRHSISQLPGRHIEMDGEKWLYFAGTSYLGIQHLSGFRELVEEGLQRFGTHYGGSRLAGTGPGIFEEAEAFLAKYCGAAAALTCSSGSLAGQLVLRTLEQQSATIYAPDTHPAMLGGSSESSQLDSFESFVQSLPDKIKQLKHDQIVICCNSLDPLYAIAHRFDWLASLPADRRYVLVVDDSHGIGIIGKEGAGIFERIDLPGHVELVVVASLGKALGIPAGLMLGSSERISEFSRQPLFGGASPANPAFLFALLQAGDLYRKQRRNLTNNIDLFQSYIADSQLFKSISAYPVYYTAHNQLDLFLQAHRILISSFSYPRTTDPLITRVVLSSLHQHKDICYLGQCVQTFSNEM